jgi:DNA-binding MarR family transcriptional regulator
MSLIRIKHALRKTEIGAEFNVMGYIAHHGLEALATPSQIADHFHMTTPMVAKVIRTLQRKKYIVAKTDPNDHRKTRLQLTKKGEHNLKQKIGAVYK